MDPRPKKVLFVLLCFTLSVNSKAIHTSGKLDFGDATPAASFVKNEKRVPVKVSRNVDAISSPSGVTSTVSCGPRGCNVTGNNNNSVETEVLVHVQTKVNFDQSQEKKVLEDVSDVPIVVGYRGSTPDDTPNEEQFRDISNRRYGPSGNDYTSSRPVYSDSPISIGVVQNHRHEQSTGYPRPLTDKYYGTSNFYGASSPSNVFPGGYFGPTTDRPLESNNINPSLPGIVPDLNRRNYDFNYQTSGMEVQIPYFEHTYNRHYFREEPPPHTVWLGKGNVHNPVEFRNIPRNKWRPSLWNGRNHKYAFSESASKFGSPYSRNPPVSVPHRNHGTECSCWDQRTDRSSVNHHIALPSKDPGGSIDDKLAPLN